MQQGIHHHTAACKCQQKRDSLTPCQGWYQSWRQCVMPPCVWCLYPDQISPAGLPTGLDHISTRLTAYNRSHIPLYGALCGPITWQPDFPDSQPQRVNSYWYIADTPVLPSWVYPQVKNWQSWRWIVPSQSGDLSHILHLFPLQWPQPSLLQPLKQPSPSGPLMIW